MSRKWGSGSRLGNMRLSAPDISVASGKHGWGERSAEELIALRRRVARRTGDDRRIAHSLRGVRFLTGGAEQEGVSVSSEQENLHAEGEEVEVTSDKGGESTTPDATGDSTPLGDPEE